MNTFEALSAARDAIVKGWTKRSYRSHYNYLGEYDPSFNSFCAIGSIQHALGGYCGGTAKDSGEASGLFAKSLNYLTHAMAQLGFVKAPRPTLSGQYSQIISFNDKDTRTKDEVLAAFNKAVSNAKRRHLNG